LIIVFYSSSSFSQELFVNSEPASTFPARSLGIKVLTNYIPYDKVFDRAAERYLASVMIGIARNFSLSAGVGFSNMHTSNFERESFSLFCKYRFLSQDDVHKHFRMAAFLDASYSYAPFHNDEVELTGDKSGISVGLIATKLLNKVALSASVSHTQILDSSRFNKTVYVPTRIYQALNYSISSGYLLISREYKNFNQLNVNLYMELLFQQTLTQHKYYMDIAPAVQFIINSNLKLNISYRKELSGNMNRISDYRWLFGVERNFLNAWKKKSS